MKIIRVKAHKRKGTRGVKRHARKSKLVRQTPLQQAEYITLYHGTSMDKLPAILKEGLKPQPQKEFGNEPRLFLTPNIPTAIGHASYGSEQELVAKRNKLDVAFNKKKRTPENYAEYRKRAAELESNLEKGIGVILKVKVPRAQLPPNINQHFLWNSYAFGLQSSIPPKNIKVIPIDKAKSKSLRRFGRLRGPGGSRNYEKNDNS